MPSSGTTLKLSGTWTFDEEKVQKLIKLSRKIRELEAKEALLRYESERGRAPQGSPEA